MLERIEYLFLQTNLLLGGTPTAFYLLFLLELGIPTPSTLFTLSCLGEFHNGDVLRPSTDASRRDQAIRGLQVRHIPQGTAQIIREGKAVHPVRIRFCLGREGSGHAQVDGRQIMERQPSFWKLFNIPRNGGQEGWRIQQPEENIGKDAGIWPGQRRRPRRWRA